MLYKETSVIAKVYTERNGKISVITKGIRRKKHKWRAFFTVFNPLEIEIKLSTKSEGLTQLYGVEQKGQSQSQYHRNYLTTLSLFYINELIHLLVPLGQADENLFLIYQKILQGIQINSLELNLRLFEFNMLESLGYGVNFECDSTHEELVSKEYYAIKPMSLPEKVDVNMTSGRHVFSGDALINLRATALDKYSLKMLKDIKYILRLNIDYLLNDRILKSRELVKEYIKMKAINKDLNTTPDASNESK